MDKLKRKNRFKIRKKKDKASKTKKTILYNENKYLKKVNK